MSRRTRPPQDALSHLLAKVKSRFDGTPVHSIGHLLESAIVDVQALDSASSPAAIEVLSTYIETALVVLPEHFGERFDFDAQLIAAIAEEFSKGAIKMSGMLVPRPADEWGHQKLAMPSKDRSRTYVVDVIRIPSGEKIEHVDLLDYPFICHEMGHIVLSRNGKTFIETFSTELNEVTTSIQRQMLGIRGAAKTLGEQRAAQMRAFWTPTPDQFNWAHEIAVDTISLWVCGPAYLAAMHDVMDDDGLDPFQLGQSHPPYELRAVALLEAANRLGWAYYATEIQTLIDKWSKAVDSGARTNLHVACADSRLWKGAVSASLTVCEELALPRFTPDDLKSLEAQFAAGQHSVEFGTNVILAAWLKRAQCTEAEFATWEQAVIQQLIADITP